MSVHAAHIWHLPPDWQTHIRPERYGFFNLWFVWAGEGRLEWAGGVSDLKPGTCALLRPWGDYRAWHNPEQPVGYTRISFFIRDADGRDPPERNLPPVIQHPTDWHLADVVLRKVVHAWAEGGPLSRGAAEDYLRAFVGHLECDAHRREHHGDVMRLQPVIEMIREDPRKHYGVNELARHAHLSRNHFTRLFRKATGESPAQYILGVRIQLACQLLEGDHRVKEIAQQLGYPDLFTFSRQFKKKLGVSPSAYRRGIRRREQEDSRI